MYEGRRASENVKILSKKGKDIIILTLATPLARKLAKKMKKRPSSEPFEPKNWLMRLTHERA